MLSRARQSLRQNRLAEPIFAPVFVAAAEGLVADRAAPVSSSLVGALIEQPQRPHQLGCSLRPRLLPRSCATLKCVREQG